MIRIALVVVAAGCLSKPELPDLGDPPLFDGLFAAGTKHACWIDGTGRLACWGDNTFGQLGASAPAGASGTPVVVPGTWTAVATGSAHTCGIRDGGVVCFGDSEFCESGPCMHMTGETAVPLPAGVSPAKLFAGGYSTCVIGDDTRLYCWGNLDVTAPSPIEGASRIDPAGLTDGWVDIAMEFEHMCAVHSEGTTYCWGHADDHDLGSSDDVQHGISDAIIPQHRFLQVAVAPAATCGITLAHGLACWGTSFVTQGDFSPSVVIDAGPKWSTIAVGYGHVCGIHDHHVRCYGLDDRGALGDDFAARPRLADASVVDDAVDVVAGDGFSCARTTRDEVSCWGTNESGELGNGEIATEHAPVQVEGIDNVLQVAAGGGHTCALRANGDVVCWGDNRLNQVSATADRFFTIPAPAALSQGALRVVTGANHTCAGVSNGAANPADIRCWGDNRAGQLGPGSVVTAQSGAWTALSAGGDTTCAVDSAGTLECWGDIPTVTTSAPMTVPGVFATVAVGSGFLVGVDTSMGNQGVLEVANNNADCSISSGAPLVNPVPRIPDDSEVREVAASQLGAGHVCERQTAVSVDTTSLICWGANSRGQSAAPTGDCADTSTFVPMIDVPPVAVGEPPKIAVGGDRSCALDVNEAMYCWGDNTDGLLGPLIDVGSTPTPTLAVVQSWSTLSVGPHHTCGVDKSRNVFCWGRDQFGEVGNNKRFHETPVPLAPAITP